MNLPTWLHNTLCGALILVGFGLAILIALDGGPHG